MIKRCCYLLFSFGMLFLLCGSAYAWTGKISGTAAHTKVSSVSSANVSKVMTVGTACGALGSSCSVAGDCCSSYCYVDSDGDGYAPSSGSKTCRASAALAGTDCYDSNVNVYPGQTAYFSAHRGDSSFDYDCSGDLSYDISCIVCTGATPTDSSICSGLRYGSCTCSGCSIAASCGAATNHTGCRYNECSALTPPWDCGICGGGASNYTWANETKVYPNDKGWVCTLYDSPTTCACH